MPSHKGRDLLLKIGNAAVPEVFSTLGVARTVAMTLDNRAADATTMNDGGLQKLCAGAGLQTLEIRLEGLFKDSAAEEILRAAAFGRTSRNYQLFFPNGDKYAAAFCIDSYARTGAFDGLETFAATLRRDGAGVFTAG